MNSSLPSYAADVKPEPFVARLLALRDVPADPPTEPTPFEIGTVNGVPVRIGFRVPDPPAPPSNGSVTGYELQAIGHRVHWMQEQRTPAEAVQYLLSLALQTYGLHALAACDDGACYRALWDFTAREWQQWELT